jgi:hypothetical protein
LHNAKAGQWAAESRYARLPDGSKPAAVTSEQLSKFPRFLPISTHQLRLLEGRACLG